MSTTTKPTIVCLCGSTRFIEEFAAANERETIAGHIVLTVGVNMNDLKYADVGTEDRRELKERLDALHLTKIDMATEVLVINKNGYIGESTCAEVIYAYRKGKTIRWLEPKNAPHPLELTQRPPFKLHRYTVGIGSSVEEVEAPTPEAAAMFYGIHGLNGNAMAQLMVAVYAEDGCAMNAVPWARYALGKANEDEFAVAVRAINPQLKRCRFVEAEGSHE